MVWIKEVMVEVSKKGCVFYLTFGAKGYFQIKALIYFPSFAKKKCSRLTVFFEKGSILLKGPRAVHQEDTESWPNFRPLLESTQPKTH